MAMHPDPAHAHRRPTEADGRISEKNTTPPDHQMPLRLLCVIDSLAVGGAEKSLLMMIPTWRDLGTEVHVAFLGPNEALASEFEESGAILHGPLGKRVHGVRALVALIRELRPDLVHTTLFESDVAGRIAARLCRVPSLTTWACESYDEAHRRRPGIRITRFLLARLVDAATTAIGSRVHAVSHAAARSNTRKLWVRPGKVIVVPRGRPTALTTTGGADPERVRRSLGLHGERPLALAVARHEHAKGLDVAIAAIGVLRDRGVEIDLVVAGREGNATSALEAAAAVAGVSDLVHMLGVRDDVPDLMAVADLFISASRAEGSPGALIEAMAVGVPVIVSDIEPNIEVLGGVSRTFPVDDPTSLANLVQKQLQGALPADSEELRDRFRSQFELDSIASRMHNIHLAVAGLPNLAHLRVLHVISDDDRRGAQVFASDLDEAMRQLGHRSQVVALRPGDVGGIEGARVLGRSRFDPRTMLRLRQAMTTSDIAIAHGSTAVLGCALMASRRRRFVVRQISETSFWVDSSSRALRVKAYLARSVGVVALASSSAEQLTRITGVSPAKIEVIPNGVPGDRICRAGARPSDRSDEEVRIGFIGALVPEKGADMAIRSVAASREARLAVVGDGPERGALESLANSLAPGRVEFLGSVADVTTLISDFDVVVLPSRGGDSMPAVLIEAGFAGLPTVSSRVGAIPDVVVDGETGILHDPDDQRGLDEAVDRLIANAQLRRSMGGAARRRMLASFDINVIAAQWVVYLTRQLGQSVSSGNRDSHATTPESSTDIEGGRRSRL